MDAGAWLLAHDDPAIRAKALVELEGRRADDAEVQAARKESVERGSVARMLAGLPDVPSTSADELYLPKYNTVWHRLVALAEMGAPAEEPRVARVLDACLDAFAKPEGGFGRKKSHLCTTGNLARAATRLGRGDDPRVRSAVEWLVTEQQSDGGWHCWPEEEPHGTLDAWEALGAFAAMPAARRPRDALARGVDFLLANRLGFDDDYEPWRRIHFPRHYYYDALVGLDIATELGLRASEPRLAPALAWLRGKQGADGLWRLDGHHPDFDAAAGDYQLQPGTTPLVVEEPGAPSGWATLFAMRVLTRAG